MAKKQAVCPVCGFTSTPGAMGMHKRMHVRRGELEIVKSNRMKRLPEDAVPEYRVVKGVSKNE